MGGDEVEIEKLRGEEKEKLKVCILIIVLRFILSTLGLLQTRTYCFILFSQILFNFTCII